MQKTSMELNEMEGFFQINGGCWITPSLKSMRIRGCYNSPSLRSIHNAWRLSISFDGVDSDEKLHSEIKLRRIWGEFSAENVRIGVLGNEGEFLTCDDFYPPFKFPLIHGVRVLLSSVTDTDKARGLRIFVKIDFKHQFEDESLNLSTTKTEIQMPHQILRKCPLKRKSELFLKDKGIIKCSRCAVATTLVFENSNTTETTKKKITDHKITSNISIGTYLDYLHFRTTGSIDKRLENALELYEVGVLLRESKLEELCRDHVHKSISVENFCDVLTFSLNYSDLELEAECESFFVNNTWKILESPQ